MNNSFLIQCSSTGGSTADSRGSLRRAVLGGVISKSLLKKDDISLFEDFLPCRISW